MSTAGDENLTYALEGVLFPTLIIFVCGWLIGAVGILDATSVRSFNMAVLEWILPCAVFSGFLNYRLTGPDVLFFVPNILDKILSAIPAFLPYFLKKINLRMACTLWLTGIYSNALSYGNYFLYVYYTDPSIPTFCSLSTVPDNIILFPIIIFMLEYSDYKKKLEEDPKAVNTTGFKIFLNILLRVLKNRIVWSCFFGVILNQAVLGPGGKFPTWISRFFTLGAQCTLPISMFLMGVFTATYTPIHSNVMRFFCCILSPLKNLCCASDKVEESGAAESVKSDPNVLKNAEEGKGSCEGKEGSDGGNSSGSGDDSNESSSGASEVTPTNTSTPDTASPVPKPADAPAAAAPAPSPPKDAAAAVNSADYKFNWILTITEMIIRHLFCPGLMILLCLMFGSALPVLQKHALILIASLGTPGVVFSVSRLYNAYPGEAAITQVIGSFILTLPGFLLFYYITKAIFPL